ncbi:MAG: ribonuclease HII [Fastidiosipilaceae bacterium]|jgi:ribonuclease HII|nr:ribonuclease HII [Clostridiaceae bacterium]
MTLKETPEARYERMSIKETELRQQGYQYIAGVDEAGRGPLAGPVFAAAVILSPDRPIIGLNDSKKMTEKERDRLYDLIKIEAEAWGIGYATEKEIDEINILQATRLAMRRALSELDPEPSYVLFDWIKSDYNAHPSEYIKKGDLNVNAIAAASILAKVERDRLMIELAKQYPGYGFEKNKGYGTKMHYSGLDQQGPCPAHRRSFLKKWQQRKNDFGK